MVKKLFAESLGTFVLVFGGCGSAAIAAAFPGLGIGFVGVSLAFGLTVLAGVCALGHISGAHLNPAVSVGLATAGRFPWKDVPGYVIAQVAGAVAAAGLLLLLLQGQPGGYDAAASGLAANGYGEHSPGQYSMLAGFLAEVVLTFIFLSVILGATHAVGTRVFAGVPIGLALTLVHLVGIPVTNVSVNPARSTGPALFVGGWAILQLWMFWLAPVIGAFIAGAVARWLYAPAEEAKPRERFVPEPHPATT